MADERLNIAEQRLAFTERRLGQEESRSRKLEADLAGALHRVKQMESELSGVVHQIKESNIQWKEYKDIIEAFGKSHPIDPRSMVCLFVLFCFLLPFVFVVVVFPVH